MCAENKLMGRVLWLNHAILLLDKLSRSCITVSCIDGRIIGC